MGSYIEDELDLVSLSYCDSLSTHFCKMEEEGTKAQPIIIVVEKSSTKVSLEKSYKSRAATIIGAIHILCGLVAFTSNIALMVVVHIFHVGIFGTGIWSSVFFIISGSLSICSGKNTNSCLIISTMVMSIISAISAGILVIFSALGLDHDGYGCRYYNNDYYYRNCKVNPDIFHGIQLLAGIIEMVLAISSASISCKATCCRDKITRDTTTPYKVVYKPDSDLDHLKIVSLALNIKHLDQELLQEDQENHGKGFAYNKFS